MPTLTLYHRPNCHLCDAMLAEIRTLYADSLEIQLVNVESDESLHERYWLKIPVLAVWIATALKPFCPRNERVRTGYVGATGWWYTRYNVRPVPARSRP